MNTKHKTILMAAAIVLGASTFVSTAAFAGTDYALKGVTKTGTQIPTVDARGTLPFDKRYFELTNSQRDIYRSRFQTISESQVPPFPRNGLSDVYRPLIDANERGVRGSLKMQLNISSAGQVESVSVLGAPNSTLSKAAVAAVQNVQFNPGYCEGQPCAMTVPIQITYK